MKYTATLNGKQYDVELERIGEYEPIPRYGEAAPAPAAPITAPAAAPAPAPAAAPAEVQEAADDTELIAVIAAAIAAAEGTTTDGFVVRSIRKINRKKR